MHHRLEAGMRMVEVPQAGDRTMFESMSTHGSVAALSGCTLKNISTCEPYPDLQTGMVVCC